MRSRFASITTMLAPIFAPIAAGGEPKLGRMPRLLVIPITDDDARWLVTRLFRDAHASAVSAALMITRGVELDLYAVALTPAERNAILGVLDDPPDSLAELRGALVRDHQL